MIIEVLILSFYMYDKWELVSFGGERNITMPIGIPAYKEFIFRML